MYHKIDLILFDFNLKLHIIYNNFDTYDIESDHEKANINTKMFMSLENYCCE